MAFSAPQKSPAAPAAGSPPAPPGHGRPAEKTAPWGGRMKILFDHQKQAELNTSEV